LRIGNPLNTKGRKHGHGFAHDSVYTRSLRTQGSPLSDVR
jgi:hypothetical protein